MSPSMCVPKTRRRADWLGSFRPRPPAGCKASSIRTEEELTWESNQTNTPYTFTHKTHTGNTNALQGRPQGEQ
uniref:Uncharacterized protein n=1 Tax=Anguilla anguilla TaxID=7936 RepID=A0A0E9WT68_ANGAN